MSHHQIFVSFQNGEPTGFNLDQLLEILKQHNCVSTVNADSNYFVAFPIEGHPGGTIGDEGGIYLQNGMAVEFGIERPYYDEAFFALAFDLISRLGVCMFDSAAENAFVTDDGSGSNLPEVLAPHVRKVSSIAEMKRWLFEYP